MPPPKRCPRCRLQNAPHVAVCPCGFSFEDGKAAVTLTRPAGGAASAAEIEEGATAYRRLVQLVGLQVLLAVSSRLVRYALEGSEPWVDLVVSVPFLAGGLALLLAGAVVGHTLSMRIDARPAWLWSLALALPGLGIAALLYLNPRAAAWCRRHGIDVGLLGPTAAAVARLRGARRSPLRTGADRLITGMAVALAGSLVLLVAALRYIRPAIEDRRVKEEVRGDYARVTALAPADAAAFFEEAHRECFRKAYQSRWYGGAFNREAYDGCLDAAFQDRLGRLVVLEGPEWVPHPDPGWEKLAFTVRIVDGQLPREPTVLTVLDCADGQPFRTERPADGFADPSTGAKEARASALVPRRPRPCRLTVSLKWGRWQLGEGLAVETHGPAPAPAAGFSSDGASPTASSDAAGIALGLPRGLVDPLLKAPSVSLQSWEWLTPGKELKIRVKSQELVSLAEFLSALEKLPECALVELTSQRPDASGLIEAEVGIRLKTAAPTQ